MPSSSRTRILVAGGGVAGLETILALREQLGDSASVELIAPHDGLTYWPLAVAEPFGVTPGFEINLRVFAREMGAGFRHDALSSVDVDANRARTRSGESVEFDFLIAAVGAKALPAMRNAFTFTGPDSVQQFRSLLYRIERGELGSVVFVVPESGKWLLPMYELALMTAVFAKARLAQPQLTIVTDEDPPLRIFGEAAASQVENLLREWGIVAISGVQAEGFRDGVLHTEPEQAIVADEVVTLPRLEGPYVEGLPADDQGFIHVDSHGRVVGRPGVFAAGDATTFPIKHGGIAAQQADTVAETIAFELGRIAEPAPFRPSLDGVLLTGEFAYHLHRSLAAGTAAPPRRERDEWWPLGKVFARHLGDYLTDRGDLGPTPPAVRSDSLADELKGERERRVLGRRSE